MVTEYETTSNHTALWWTLGAIVVLFILWFAFFHNRNAGIPNTGTDNTASSSTGLYDSTNTTGGADNSTGNATDNNTNQGSPAVTDQSKG
jgi:hypothetical protein